MRSTSTYTTLWHGKKKTTTTEQFLADIGKKYKKHLLIITDVSTFYYSVIMLPQHLCMLSYQHLFNCKLMAAGEAGGEEGKQEGEK